MTTRNLEERLHFYRLDGRGITIEKQISGTTDDESARKQFTAALIPLCMHSKTLLSEPALRALLNARKYHA